MACQWFPVRYWRLLVGAPVAGRACTAIVVSAEVDGLAAEGAAVVNQRLVLFDGHLVGCCCIRKFRYTRVSVSWELMWGKRRDAENSLGCELSRGGRQR